MFTRYAEAAWFGSRDAFFYWAVLLAFGAEGPDIGCGMDESVKGVRASEFDHARAVYALVRAVEMGHAAAIFPLMTMISTGIGVSAFGMNESVFLGGKNRAMTVPVPQELGASVLFPKLSSLLTELISDESCRGLDSYAPGKLVMIE